MMKIPLESLYRAINSGLQEGRDVPYFDDKGKRIGTIIHVMLSDGIQARVRLDDGKFTSVNIHY
jgi:hypothetical protein